MELLAWAGITWDEGPDVGGPYGPYIQSERLHLYQDAAESLIKSGHAYRCYCTPDRLAELRSRQTARSQPVGYDRRCLFLAETVKDGYRRSGASFVVRMKTSTPPTSQLPHISSIPSKTKMHQRPPTDPILIKADKFPTYHLGSVADDRIMRVTHVLRGVEWLPSTSLHISMHKALSEIQPSSAPTPIFTHLPLLVNAHGAKLSKRDILQDGTSVDGSVAVLKASGYSPEAVVSFVASLGWSGNPNMMPLTMQELVAKFSLSDVGRAPAVVSFEQLQVINKRHLQRRLSGGELAVSAATVSKKRFDGIIQMDPNVFQQLTDELRIELQSEELTRLLDEKGEEYLRTAISVVQDRARSVTELVQLVKPFYADPSAEVLNTLRSKSADESVSIIISLCISEFESALSSSASSSTSMSAPSSAIRSSVSSAMPISPEFSSSFITDVLNTVSSKGGYPFGRIMKSLRVVMTGSTVGGGLAETMQVLGPDVVLRRLRNFKATLG